MRRSLKHIFLVTTVFGMSVHEAVAQQLEEVVVTARKRAENLQDVPLTVTAFTSEAIQRSGIKTVEDVIRFTPGLNFDKGFAPQDTRPSIRGLPLVRGKPPVGTLLDGIDVSSESISTAGGSSLMNLKLVDVEQIEVVKGPQSALYGRSAFGGAISYVSKRPNLNAVEGSVNVDVATHNLYEVRGALNVPVVEDRVAVRVNAIYSYFDGFYKNTVTNNTIGGDKMAGGSVAIRFKPSDSVDFTFRTSYSDDKSEARPSYYFGGANGLQSARPLPANVVGQVLGGPTVFNTMPATYNFGRVGTIDVKGNTIALSVDPFTNKDYDAGRLRPLVNSLVGEIDLGFAKLSSWTGYMTARAASKADADFYGAAPTNVTLPTPGIAEPLGQIMISDFHVKASQFSQEVRIGNLDSKPFRWAIGGLAWIERYKSDNGTLTVNKAVAGTNVPGFSIARAVQILGPVPVFRSARNTDHTSAYGIFAYDITSQLEASVEARYAHEKVSSILGQLASMNVNATGTVVSYGATALTTNPRPVYSTNMFTPRAVVKYKFDGDNSVYASYSRGKKPGGYLNVGVVTGNTEFVRYNPERIDNFEVGFKSTWMDNRVRLNGAYFHANDKGRVASLLVADPTSPQGSSTQATNLGEAKIDGAELEISAAVAEGLTASVAYSYINARFTSSDAPQTTAFGIAGPGNCATITNVGLARVCITNTNGNMLDFSNKHTFTGTINYVKPITSDWDLTAELDFQARSHRFIDGTNLWALPGYVNFDAKVGIQNKAYSVLLYVNNLFNDLKPKTGQTGGDQFATNQPTTAYFVYAADKRQIGLRAGVKF